MVKRRLNFELNLVPFVDVLSVCICFLLMTAVFIQLGTVNVKQAMGDGPALLKDKAPATLTVRLTDDGDVILNFKNVKGKSERDVVFTGYKSTIDWNKTVKYIAGEKNRHVTLKTAMILPANKSKYADVVRFMDELKQMQIENIGIAPL